MALGEAGYWIYVPHRNGSMIDGCDEYFYAPSRTNPYKMVWYKISTKTIGDQSYPPISLLQWFDCVPGITPPPFIIREVTNQRPPILRYGRKTKSHHYIRTPHESIEMTLDEKRAMQGHAGV